MNKATLREAVRFHGHLGPWLVLGLLMGPYALKKIRAGKYFKLRVKVWGAGERPKSCLIDGLQLSTGATYGKGNIEKLKGPRVRVLFHNLENNKKALIYLKKGLAGALEDLKSHRDSERFAMKLCEIKPSMIFTDN
ncbi:MAG: formylmethanofuran dehydrogenase subunit E family protein [Candidatus Omnitrophica bacterium]|nr:formylmethanofuran dehydrogenase subunit E family protein [Candidatus Omnitrophota bacterium]